MKKVWLGIAVFITIFTVTFGIDSKKIILDKTNQIRIEKGLKPLILNEKLNEIADIKAQDMLKDEKLSHTSKRFGLTFNLLKKRGIEYKSAGENIARWHDTPEFVMERWLKSEGHRKNILNSKYTDIGIGQAQDKEGKNYWVQIFIERKN